jgi:phage major head subunit gpT-like protein
MNSLTPSFVFKYEKQMRAISEEEYARALLQENVWWTDVSKLMNIDSASERLTWFLSTAEILPTGKGGNIPFSTLVTQSTELVPQRYAAGIKVEKDQLLDLRAGGLDILADWSRQIGSQTAYFPQQLVAESILNGANTDGSANAYDGVPFFADNSTSNTFDGTTVIGHPTNPWRPTLGGYTNWLHGSSATVTQPNGATYTYPGALPIDDSVTIDVAFKNLGIAIAFVAGLKMPNGKTPRFIRPRKLLVPPRMVPRAAELLGAYFIAQAANSGGGSGDVRATIRRWGFDSDPVEVAEFSQTTNYTTQILQAAQTSTGQASGVISTYNETIVGNDTTYYLVMEQNRTSMLGGLVHVVREPFKTNFFSGEAGLGGANGLDAILNRALEIEYIHQGRMSVQYGHPYALFRIDGS